MKLTIPARMPLSEALGMLESHFGKLDRYAYLKTDMVVEADLMDADGVTCPDNSQEFELRGTLADIDPEAAEKNASEIAALHYLQEGIAMRSQAVSTTEENLQRSRRFHETGKRKGWKSAERHGSDVCWGENELAVEKRWHPFWESLEEATGAGELLLPMTFWHERHEDADGRPFYGCVVDFGHQGLHVRFSNSGFMVRDVPFYFEPSKGDYLIPEDHADDVADDERTWKSLLDRAEYHVAPRGSARGRGDTGDDAR